MTNGNRPTPAEMARLLAGEAGGPRRRTHLPLWLIAGAALTAAIAISLATSETSAARATDAYTTEPVTLGSLEVQVSATGNLQPTNTVEVGSELSGLVETVLVDENDTVRKGQVLARLDTSKLRDQITKSEASLKAAEARLAQSKATVAEASASRDRLREVSRLSDGKVPSRTEMEAAEAAYARAVADQGSAEAAVIEAQAALSSDQTNLHKASIRSPITGIVLSRVVEPGQAVAASLQVATLFTIAEDLRQMELQVDVDEADVGRVEAGQLASFTVDAYPSRTYDAAVVRVAFGSTTSGDVVSYAALLSVDNDDLSLRPGMTASVEIAIASVHDVVLVPNAALRFAPEASGGQDTRGLVSRLLPGPPRQETRQVVRDAADGEHRVWILRDGAPVAVAVEIGETDGRHTEIRGGGLTPGTQVITGAAAGASS
ncbi:MAG: efflux RND transporter periplasmic adaptor subunit [Vicinamibacterales bacterium]